MKRWFSLFLAAVLLLLTACGAGGSDSSAANGGGAVGSVEEGSWDLDMSGDNIDSSTMSRPGVFDTVAPEAPQEPAGTQAAGERRKVIYTASIRMETRILRPPSRPWGTSWRRAPATLRAAL